MKPSATAGEKLRRCALLLIGVAILLWSSLEDKDPTAAVTLGALASIALTLWLLSRLAAGRALKPAHIALSGAVAGALASLCTAALMLFKNLRHAHVFPDYPAEMLLAVLQRLPPWTIAGGLAGLGIGLLLASRLNEANKRRAIKSS